MVQSTACHYFLKTVIQLHNYITRNSRDRHVIVVYVFLPYDRCVWLLGALA